MNAPRRAFTLIELLVVISIIALLISILLPALTAARRSALYTQCMAQQKQVALGAINYAVEHDGKFPPSSAEHTNIPGRYTHPSQLAYGNNTPAQFEGRRLQDHLRYYVPIGETMVCPLVPNGGASAIALYENPTMTTNGGNFSYFFLWSYKQWDEKKVPGSSAFGTFVAPSSLEEPQVSDLITSDVLSWVGPNLQYYSAHMEGNMAGIIDGGNAVYTKIVYEPAASLRVNSGYRDGSVRSEMFSELKKNALPWIANLWFYLPE